MNDEIIIKFNIKTNILKDGLTLISWLIILTLSNLRFTEYTSTYLPREIILTISLKNSPFV